ncbi:hypothetical protein GVN21_13070 [Caulobacter sp. SLTY]|uniref:hypothetical protein n=1 Tax=Caulobacter sp. SLTY TaxID=2683262 RepID=UPI001411F442|nr:hypothetical protein [Caulobacter sp. SLTY]NBB16291.1 hypothetical protein [Caulobacter sp. SLTY]
MPPEDRVRPTLPEVTPEGDGSEVFWDVFDVQTGRRLWSIEAADFEAALFEKRRLYRLAGGKSGRGYLAPAED